MAVARLRDRLDRWTTWARHGAQAYDAGRGVRVWTLGADLPAAEVRAVVGGVHGRAAALAPGAPLPVHVVALPHLDLPEGERGRLRAVLRRRLGRRYGVVYLAPDERWRERLAHALASLYVSAFAAPEMEQAARAALVLRVAGLGVTLGGPVT